MPIFPVISMIEELPTFEQTLQDIIAPMRMGWALERHEAIAYLTKRQRNWYKGICLPGLSDWSGDSVPLWDRRLKQECCGLALLKKEILLTDNGTPLGRLTTTGVGKRNMTTFIEEILSKAIDMDWPVQPPDPDLRRI